ncbi:MAG: hypothetical protein ACOYM2_19280 [Rectinemataceae bacterium]
MSDQLSSQLPAILFAAALAVLLFSAFLNPAVKQRILSWWRSLEPVNPGIPVDRELLTKPGSDAVTPLRSGVHEGLAHVEKKGLPLHRRSPHVEKLMPRSRKQG